MIEILISNFDKYQTLVVGLLGFLGVIYTIRMNARLARDQRERHLNHERAALRTALYAELTTIRRTYEDRSQSCEASNGRSVFIPEYVPHQIYHQLLDRIGLLTLEEIEPVIQAYLLVAELPVRLRLLSRDSGNPGESSGYIHIGEDYVEVVAGIHVSFLSSINSAIEVLKRNIEAPKRESAWYRQPITKLLQRSAKSCAR